MHEVNSHNTGPEVNNPVLPADMGSRLKTAVELKRAGVNGDQLADAINEKHGTRQKPLCTTGQLRRR